MAVKYIPTFRKFKLGIPNPIETENPEVACENDELVRTHKP